MLVVQILVELDFWSKFSVFNFRSCIILLIQHHLHLVSFIHTSKPWQTIVQTACMMVQLSGRRSIQLLVTSIFVQKIKFTVVKGRFTHVAIKIHVSWRSFLLMWDWVKTLLQFRMVSLNLLILLDSMLQFGEQVNLRISFIHLVL